MKVELEIMSDVIGPTNKVIKKDVIYKKVFETDKIEVEQFISSRGIVMKKYCTVLSQGAVYKCNNTYEYVKGLTLPIEVKGLLAKSKRCK